MRSILARPLILALLVLSSTSLPAADPPEGIEFFEKKIRPVLVAKCYRCHSSESDEVNGGLLLDSRENIRRGGDLGPAVAPGKESESLLLEAIRYESLEMPPDERLAPAVIKDFEKWIAMGAPDPRDGKARAAAPSIDIEEGRKHWAYQPVSDPPVPKTQDAAWPRTDIDRFILAGLEAKQLRPVADAAPLDLLRRISYDLTGLPPTPDRIREFPAAYEKDPTAAITSLVDRLLESPRFGERWGRHWLDLARYAESAGGTRNMLVPLAPRYRDYVIAAFNADKPYDRFVREQLAGDLMPAESDAVRDEQLTATGFLALGPKEFDWDDLRFRMTIVAEQIDVVGRVFLGQTLACAECHDHKFDPFSTADYYALAGIFYSSKPRMGLNPKESAFVGELAPLSGADATFTDEDCKRKREQWSKAYKATAFLRDEKRRLLTEAGLTRASEREQEAFLAKQPSVQKAAAAKEEQDARLAAIEEQLHAAMRQSIIGMRDLQEPKDLAIHIRGELRLLGEVVPRGFPKVLTGESTPQVNREQSGRLELADWIASPDNPLIARVMVNRIWQHLFGAGLVNSPDNFGATGEPPSNPALLDHLAQRFIAHDWSVKSMIREIVLSRVYQLSADHDEAAYAVDPANRLHWRMSRRRLESEAILDSMRVASGELKLGPPPERFAITKGDQRIKSFDRQAWREPVENYRTVYQPIFREFVPFDWSVFDFPDPALLNAERAVTTVPPQALFMMNSSFAVEQSRKLAEQIRSSVEGDGGEAAVRQAYVLVLGRFPTEQEIAEGREFLDQFRAEAEKPDRDKALAVFCQALFASAEFRYTY
ncbi:MAG: PSD1 and planctomycete cytochrome C domain-containing protein [Planctomycetes bacterium]|nr:PSD1 and planctomycete cytochrome C domain-containing protein [Planctomycetota bacterium]